MRKWTPQIIVVITLAVFMVLFSSCLSGPSGREPELISHDPGIPEDQLATLFVPPGYYQVTQFNGIRLQKDWYQASMLSRGMNVRIPAGSHSIVFHYHIGGSLAERNRHRNLTLEFTVEAGKTYALTAVYLNSRSWGRQSEFAVIDAAQ